VCIETEGEEVKIDLNKIGTIARVLPKMVFVGAAVLYLAAVKSPSVVLEDEDHDHDEISDEVETEAAYITTGLITAGRQVAKSHEEEEDCNPGHLAVHQMLSYIDNSTVALLVIRNLIEVVSPSIDDEEVEMMVRSIVEDEFDSD
jgi:hypothetical protein